MRNRPRVGDLLLADVDGRFETQGRFAAGELPYVIETIRNNNFDVANPRGWMIEHPKFRSRRRCNTFTLNIDNVVWSEEHQVWLLRYVSDYTR